MNKKEALEIVKRDGLALKNLPQEFQRDKEIVFIAIESNPSAIEYVHDNLKNEAKARLNWWYNFRNN
jgi:hypothetical protein